MWHMAACTAAMVFACCGPASHADVTESKGPAPQGLMRWLDPSTAPFIPIPEIDLDPNSGATIGLIPTWLKTDDQSQISEIIAPDIIHNPNFGYGARGRIFSYPSPDTQWYLVAGAKQHVEKEFDFEFLNGLLRDQPLSFGAGVVYDQNGTTRFYGIGNRTRRSEQSNYTFEQKYLQATIGSNWSRYLQLSYSMRLRAVDVQSGHLTEVPSTDRLFPGLLGLGVGHETLHRLELIGDTRDDITLPSRGGKYVLYAGIAASHGLINDSLYRVAGIDVRQLWSLSEQGVVAAHAAWRIMPVSRALPFWTLSTVGGDQSVLGESQPLRAYGAGRFYDRNSFSASIEYRRKIAEFSQFSSHIDLQAAPFIDVGQVFARAWNPRVDRLHRVGGLGLRGIASPFIVGYLDVGYGSEGAAVFTGLNYPF